MENNDSDDISEESEDSGNSKKRRRHSESSVESEDSFESNSDHYFTPNDARRCKSKISSSQSKKTSSVLIYQCSLCSFQTNLKPNLKRHFKACSRGIRRSRVKSRDQVTTGARFRCEYCQSETKTLKNLLLHKQSHSELVASGLIECNHCNLSFFTIEEWTEHMNDTVTVGYYEKKPLVCLQCQRETNSQMRLDVHTALDHVKSGCPFTCFKQDCGFETDHKDELKGHLMDTHNVRERLFRPLTDAYSEGQQGSFRCSKCFYEINDEVYLKAHYLNSHSTDSEAPFRCPWTECLKYLAHKRSLRQHLKMMHDVDPTDGTVLPSDQCRDPDGLLLLCPDCNHKSQTDLQILIHRALYHYPWSQKEFGCPLPECVFTTTYRQHVRRHLKEVHKLGEEYFRDYGVERPEEQFESDEAEDVDVQLDIDLENLDEVSVVDCDYEDKSLSTKTKYKCELCVFTAKNKRPFWRHQVRVHHKRQCDMCEKIVWGKFQWFWHNYSVHNRQRGSEIYQWWLRCDLCSYEGSTKSSYKHGATHELPTVMFLTLFWNVASGYVTFHYAEHESSNIGLGNTGHEEETSCVAPSAIKVLDGTRSDEKGNAAKTLQLLGTEEAITVEFVDSDAEAETQSNSGNANHNDRRLKKSEFFTCKKCNFRTQNAVLLRVHGVQVHGRGKTGQIKQYRCPKDDCLFQSKYLSNLKRHLMDMHKHRSCLWQNESPSTRWRTKSEVKREEEDSDIRGLENPENCLDIETDAKDISIDDNILNDDNEVIRIEVIEDAVENLVEPVIEAKTATSRIKCKNEGCDYVCHDTDDIQKHAESCTKSLSRPGQSPEEVVCPLCKIPLPDKDTLRIHIRYKHLFNQKAKTKTKKKVTVKRRRTPEKIPDRVSFFKCWMCSMRLLYASALRNHTYVHAREQNNFNLKVRYSEYNEGIRVGTIVTEAVPAYLSASNSDDLSHIRVPSPELDYDSELPVFACAECNFKTNKELELTQHKNLHWSEEKTAVFDSKKWFTCDVCYFLCLDAATFKEHADKHKSRPDTMKVEKDSWIV